MAYAVTSLGIPIATQNPMLTVTQIDQGIQNARATGARRNLMAQQTAASKQLTPLRAQQMQGQTAQLAANTQHIQQMTPAQVQMAYAQADAVDAHNKLIAQNPLLSFGNNPIAQGVYLSKHPLTAPVQPVASSPSQGVPTQPIGQPSTSLQLAHQALSSVGAQPVPSVAQQPLQPTQPQPQPQPQTPTQPLPPQPTDAATDPYAAVNKYANDFANK